MENIKFLMLSGPSVSHTDDTTLFMFVILPIVTGLFFMSVPLRECMGEKQEAITVELPLESPKGIVHKTLLKRTKL